MNKKIKKGHFKYYKNIKNIDKVENVLRSKKDLWISGRANLKSLK